MLLQYHTQNYSPVDIFQTDDNGWSCLHIVSSIGNLPILQLLLSSPQFQSFTAHERYACINLPSQNGKCTALHYASGKGNHAIVSQLLNSGSANVQATDSWGNTPLHRAASVGNEEICRLLLQHGADLFKKNAQDEDSQQLAAESGLGLEQKAK